MELKGISREVFEVKGVKFTLRAQKYSDLMYAAGKVTEMNLFGGPRETALALYPVIARVVEWEGITIDGKEAPCTEENKEALFAQDMELLHELANKVYDARKGEEEEEKNSGASRSG